MRRGPEGDEENFTEGISTDVPGRFALFVVDQNDLSFVVYPSRMAQPKIMARSPDQDLASLTLVVGREGRFRVEIATPGLRADTLRVMNGSGEVLRLGVRNGGGGSSDEEWEFDDDGKVGPLFVSEEATTLVLYRDGVEITRMAVRIPPGELTVVRP